MKKGKVFVVVLEPDSENPSDQMRINLFGNQKGEVCIEVPKESSFSYRGKIASAGISFTEDPLCINSELKTIVLSKKIETFDIETIENLLRSLKIDFHLVFEEKREVCYA